MTKSLGEENYETFADRYARCAPTKPHNALLERPATLSLLPTVAGMRVLDAGCGPGIYAEWLAERGAQVLAFDVTPAMVKIAQKRLNGRAFILHANLEKPLAFAGDAFDIVLSPLVLDYIADWESVFREFYRVLASGGWLIFSCGHPISDYIRWPQTNYYEVILTEMPWGGFGEPRPIVKAYRRPLGAIFNPLIAAGFQLDTVLEAQPTPAYADAHPEDYARYLREPTFLCVRARKNA